MPFASASLICKSSQLSTAEGQESVYLLGLLKPLTVYFSLEKLSDSFLRHEGRLC